MFLRMASPHFFFFFFLILLFLRTTVPTPPPSGPAFILVLHQLQLSLDPLLPLLQFAQPLTARWPLPIVLLRETILPHHFRLALSAPARLLCHHRLVQPAVILAGMRPFLPLLVLLVLVLL